MLLVGLEPVATGAEANGGDLVGLGCDGAGLARLSLVDRGGHDDAGAVTLDRARGCELEGLAAGIFQQRAEHFVAALELSGGLVELAGALFELGLIGGGLGAGFVEPTVVLGAFALDFGVGSGCLGAFEQGVGGRVDAPTSKTYRAEREQSLLAWRQGHVADGAAATMVNLSFRKYTIEKRSCPRSELAHGPPPPTNSVPKKCTLAPPKPTKPETLLNCNRG